MANCICSEQVSGATSKAYPLQGGERQASRLLARLDACAIAHSLQHSCTQPLAANGNACGSAVYLGTHCGMYLQLPCLGRHHDYMMISDHLVWYW
jgi:hypothetical protein